MPRRLSGRALAALVVSLVAAVALAACGSDDEAGATAAAETLTIESAFGTTVVPAEPKAALGMYTTDVDILITLGIPLAAKQPVRGDLGTTEFPEFFPQEALEGITSFPNYPDFNYDEIITAEPDFILNGLGYEPKVVKRLPEIAPTLSLDAFDGRNWREHFQETAEALGRTEQYDAWVEKYDARVAEVKASIGAKGEGLVVAPVSFWDGKATSACYTGVECSVFDDLGLTTLPAAKRKGGEGVTLSAEQVGQLADIDIGFFIGTPDELESSLEEASKNALWRELTFVKEDGIVGYPMEMTFGSPSGQMAFLDVVEQAFAER